MNRSGRLPLVRGLIEQTGGLEKLTVLEIEAVKTRPVPDALIRDLAMAEIELTPFELRVLRFIADGGRGPEGADQFGITYEAWKDHVKTLRARLGAKTLAHAVALAFRAGLIE